MGKKGRPRQSGKRHRCGKIIQSPKFDHGAEHVTIFRARFAKFQNGKAAQQVFDPIGRAWAVGLLENDRVDPAALRDAGRNYGARYWGYYPNAAGVANYEGEDQRGSSGWGDGADPRGEHFQRLDRQLLSAGREAYAACQSLCLDQHWFPDDNPAWLDRLINTRLAKAGVQVFGQLERPGDMDFLRRALDGLFSLAEGTKAPDIRSAA